MLETILSASKGVSIDTRDDLNDKIFFALKGEHFNGNDFAILALTKGAICAVVDDEKIFENASKEHLEKLYFVDNALVALQQLAHSYRQHFTIPVIGITGTNGKTTTKELVAASLSIIYKVISTKGNLNNHIGVPLTLLSMNSETEIAVIEMGANKRGDIEELCKIASPTHGLITNIGVAHLEGFGSKATIAKTKGELYKYLNDHKGTVFVNKHNADLMKLSKKIVTSKKAKVIYFGDEKIPSETHLMGTYNKENMKAAKAIATHLEVPEKKIDEALQDYVPENMRGQHIALTPKQNSVILDAYNANPSSMKASIMAFVDEMKKSEKASGKKHSKKMWIILGDMKELGKESLKEHEKLVRFLLSHKLTNVVCIGQEFGKHTQIASIYHFFENKEDFKKSNVIKNIQNAQLFIKGSRGMQLEELLPFL